MVDVVEWGKFAGAVLSIAALAGMVFKWLLKPIIDRIDGVETRVCAVEKTQGKHAVKLADFEGKHERHDWKMEDTAEQNRIIIYALSALLKVQKEQGSSPQVEKADEMLDEYLLKRPFK